MDHKPHQDLQSKVADFLIGNDFLIHDGTYGTNAKENIRKLLSRRFSLTALKVRTRADLFVIHNSIKSEFFIEFKTHYSQKQSDLCIELFPLLSHVLDSSLEIKCLYIFQVAEISGGFWAHDLPKIRQIFFPNRIEYVNVNPVLKKMSAILMPNVPIIERKTEGSGDPFCIVDNIELINCLSWNRLILDTISVKDNSINIVKPFSMGRNAIDTTKTITWGETLFDMKISKNENQR